MKTINAVLPKGRLSAQRLANNARPITEEYSNLPSSHTSKVAEFWLMMDRTFGATWSSQRGRMTNDDGYATEDFVEWSLGTSHLVDENWEYGFERIVQKMRADIAHQRDPFPPATPAIFCAMCFPPELTGNQVTQAAGQASQSFKTHPNLIAKVERENRIAADPEYAERKKKAGNETLSSLKDLF